MNKFQRLRYRKEVPKYSKLKPKPEASHLVNYKNEVEYEYYICDYCGAKIKILNKKYKMTGGIAILPYTLTKTKDLKLALCNKCVRPAIKEFEKGEV